MDAIRTPSSDIKPWEGSIWCNFDYNTGRLLRGESLMLILRGLNEWRAV
jgi:hypothetical protein